MSMDIEYMLRMIAWQHHTNHPLGLEENVSPSSNERRFEASLGDLEMMRSSFQD